MKMETVILNLMENLLTDEEVKYVNNLEKTMDIDDDVYALMNDLKLYFFKKGFKSAIEIMNYCEK